MQIPSNKARGQDVSVPHTGSGGSFSVKIEFAEDMALCASKNGAIDCSGAVVEAVKANKLRDAELDELDHMPLRERRALLLERKCLGSQNSVLESNSARLSEDLSESSTRRIGEASHSVGDFELSAARDQYDENYERSASELGKNSVYALSSMEQTADTMKEDPHPVQKGSLLTGNELNGTTVIKASELGKSSADTSWGVDCEQSAITNQLIKNPGFCMKVESDSSGNDDRECDGMFQPDRNGLNVQSSSQVKVEPSDYIDLQNSGIRACDDSGLKTAAVKCEMDVSDYIDHMILRDRINLSKLVGDSSDINTSADYERLRKTKFDAVDNGAVDVEPIRIARPRKRRKTATDSIETALEEDAPGLLKILVSQGIPVDEMRLYGEPESNDAIDESFSEDGFSELEAVIGKLFSSPRNSCLSLAPGRYTKESKRSYCLACLFSLVEQTRYLQLRKWPVEWGWCRDLQSFIFVFNRHHRIVLERPEYGFATYFFELVDILPVEWQVRRLVTSMKLTSCGRITLIENKPLSIGEEVSEGEAKVLKDYGWIPGTGLGTMLNYRDRVVHDRRNEMSDISEWKSKIGKLLTDGFCGGTVVSTSINTPEDDEESTQEVKAEPL